MLAVSDVIFGGVFIIQFRNDTVPFKACQVLAVVTGEDIAVIQGYNLMGCVVIIPIGKAHRLILCNNSGIAGLVHSQERGCRIRLIRSGAENGNIRLRPGVGVTRYGWHRPAGSGFPSDFQHRPSR